jgi:hypothetical protein
MYKFLLSACLAFFLLACSTTSPSLFQNKQILSILLQSMSEDISQIEANTLAYEIYEETKKLRKKFDPVSEPHVNNFLINVGVKEEGLCYQWSDALYLHFKKRDYVHFTFHLLVADKGKYFSEHNVMVVVAKGKPVMDGVIIDPWRKPGELYFSKVKEDTQYNWIHREEREVP